MLSNDLIKSLQALDLSGESVVVVEVESDKDHALAMDAIRMLKKHTKDNQMFIISMNGTKISALNGEQMAKFGWVKDSTVGGATIKYNNLNAGQMLEEMSNMGLSIYVEGVADGWMIKVNFKGKDKTYNDTTLFRTVMLAFKDYRYKPDSIIVSANE